MWIVFRDLCAGYADRSYDRRDPDGGLPMWFVIFLAVVALVCLLLMVRSPVFRQIRRGHGHDRTEGDAVDNAFKNTLYQKEIDPTAQPRRREWE
jgi:hypothetical protein